MRTHTNVNSEVGMPHAFDELLSAKQGAEYTGVTIGTWWEWARTVPDFPKPLRISARCTRWKRSEIDDFLESRRAI